METDVNYGMARKERHGREKSWGRVLLQELTVAPPVMEL
jgi:hypothetical protein